ncbi:hypothetical protein, partial [Dialister hominis]|uniref:hypothetical protein n=1 Tax=Dialister hominis TaxID=2582419 RepID=UPI00265D9EC1
RNGSPISEIDIISRDFRFVINDKSYVIEWFHRELLCGNGALPPRDDGFAVKREKGALGS